MYRDFGTKAFTLIEIMVAAALATVVVAMIAMLLTTTMQAQVRAMARSGLEQRAHIALSVLVSDLERCADVSLSLLVDPMSAHPVCLAAVRQEDVLAGGDRVWDSRLGFYAWSRNEGTLLRQEWAASALTDLTVALASNRPVRLSPEDLRTLSGRPGGRVLTRDVTRFGITHAGGTEANVQSPLTLTLEVTTPVPHQQPESFALSRAVCPRNSL